MYNGHKLAMVIPAYNEQLLIAKTVETVPEFVDTVIVVNDGSTDRTLEVLNELKTRVPRLVVIDNDRNHGIGYTLKNGYRYALEHTDADLIGTMAGDAQCDPDYIAPMIEALDHYDLDHVKANRFFHRDALKAMPTYRKIGNIFISLLTKFSTGYYSISDTQNGYGFFKRSIMEILDFELIGDRYDYENSMLIALSIAGARIKDHPVPAIYGDETSTIKFLPTAMRALKAVTVGFWRRIYYRYVLFSLHPIAVFLFVGVLLGILGLVGGVWLLIDRMVTSIPPSAGTVMLVVLPIILSIQMLLSSLIMDMNNEGDGHSTK